MLSSPYTLYHIKKRGQAPHYVTYTQHESIYREDVKLPLCIGNICIKQILKILKSLLKQILKFLEVNKMNYDTNDIKL